MIDLPPRGLVAELITPLSERGDVDGNGLARTMRRLAGEAVGFLAGGYGVGEAEYLSISTRIDLLVAALKNRGETILFFDVTTKGEDATADLLSRAESTLKKDKAHSGVYFYIAPLVYRGNRDLPRHMKDLSRISNRLFALANNPDQVRTHRPGRHHKNIRTSVLKKAAAGDQVAAMAYTGDLTRALNYHRALKARKNFRFYDGNESAFLDRPSSSGVISMGAQLMPQAWADIANSSLNVMDAQRLYPDHLSQIWQSGLAVRSLLEIYRTNPPAYIKAGLKWMGLIESDKTASEDSVLTENDRDRFRTALEEFHLI